MSKTITLQLSPKQAADAEFYTSLAARPAGIKRSDVALARVVKRSIDARRTPVKVNLTVEIFIDTDEQPQPIHFDYPDVSHSTEVVVVGSGPAGLFAALRLLDDPSIGMVFARCPVGGGVAYAVQNRLKKAAAFHIIDAEVEV